MEDYFCMRQIPRNRKGRTFKFFFIIFIFLSGGFGWPLFYRALLQGSLDLMLYKHTACRLDKDH